MTTDPEPKRTLGAVLDGASSRLERAGVPDARNDAEILLAYLLGTDRGGLFLQRGEALGRRQAAIYEEWIRRRAGREPLQYLTGEQEFFGRPFKVDRRALIPRPETEGLVQAALDLEPAGPSAVADLGTGSGCIAITLALERPDLHLHALDRSSEALELAHENAVRHGVEKRIEFRPGDLASPPQDWFGRMDLVLSNPPYVGETEWGGLEPEVRDHDPRQALVAGPSGYEAYVALAPAAFSLLGASGHVVLEVGLGQADRVGRLIESAGFSGVEVLPDLRRIPRIVLARKGSRRSG